MQKKNLLVSIIVRTKDRPVLLKRAIKSLAQQTYRPIEVVLVNDGGCDLDLEEIKNILGDVSLNYMRLEKNTGRAHAGNAGVENAQGEYIGFLDDDDEFYPEHVETLVTFLNQSDYKVAYTDTEMVYKEFSPEGGKIVDINKFIFSRDFSFNELLVGNYIPFNSICVSKDVFEFGLFFDEDFDLYEDWDLLIRIGQKCPFYHIKKVTAIYNQWSRDLQVNQADKEYMKAMHIKVIEKHREKVTPAIILNMKEEKDRLEFEVKELKKELKEEIKEKEKFKEIIKEKDNYISQVNDRVSKLEDIIKEKDRRISRSEDSLLAVTNTLGWRLLVSLRRLRDKILPDNTLRKKICDLGMKSAGTIFYEGWKAFFKKIKAKRKGHVLGLEISRKALNIEGIKRFITQRKFKVLFIISPWAGCTNRYRAYNMKEYLTLAGIDSDVISLEEMDDRLSWVFSFDIIVIHRIPMNDVLLALIGKCKDLSIPVIFDLDDYIFDESLVNGIDEIKRMKPAERNEWIQHVRGCRKTLDACDYFIGTTDFLIKKVEKLGKRAFLIRNGLNTTQIKESRAALRKVERDIHGIKIGFFSGTKTHQKDFEVVRPALIRILREYNNAFLCIGGFLELNHGFDEYAQRIERLPYVDWKELPFNLAKIDINISPLEPDNPFCEAKSELKYFEAALLKIPTIATPTDAYIWSIRDGENGLLASSEEEWFEKLKTLIEDASLRRNLGERAYENVMETYTPRVQARKVRGVYEDIATDYRKRTGVADEILSIGFIVSSGNDKHAPDNLLSFLKNLSEKGHVIRIYIHAKVDADRILEKLKDFQNTDSRFAVLLLPCYILSCDALIAADTESIGIASENAHRCNKLFYMSDEKISVSDHHFAHLKMPKDDHQRSSLETFLKKELSTK